MCSILGLGYVFLYFGIVKELGQLVIAFSVISATSFRTSMH